MDARFSGFFRILLIFLALGTIEAVFPFSAVFAKTAPAPKPVYSGWVPYWEKTPGAADALAHLGAFSEISPFAFEVKPDGSIRDPMRTGQDPWPVLFSAASGKNITLIPTISWIDGEAIFATLASSTLRVRHEKNILAIATGTPEFRGIEIDYEDKKAATRPYFSLFIKELSLALHKEKKLLYCAVEARTPLSSRFAKIPRTIQYANDYAVLGTYCDAVRILAYDQGTVDLLLNKAKGAAKPYIPVADAAWVEKVIREAARTIPASKIMLGIPTYGYEYELIPANGKRFAYKKVRSIGFNDAMNIAKEKGAVPARNSAGELSFTYQNATSTRIVWLTDASAIGDKLKLVKTYKLRGASIFKIDGKGDPAIWNLLTR